jgi:uncharacterized MnhB-related membrane protein
MRSIHSKFLFNAVIFLMIGIISIIRKELFETIISFTFLGIFLSLNLLIRKKENEYLV